MQPPGIAPELILITGMSFKIAQEAKNFFAKQNQLYMTYYILFVSICLYS
jgi:hypothetical protein